MGSGKSKAYVLKLKKEYREEYIKYHKEVWREVKDALFSAGVLKYKVFLTDDNLLLAYMEFKEGSDYSNIIKVFSSNEKCIKWDSIMKPFLEPVGYAKDGEWWVPVKEVFNLD
jgi:L-rhamnose mutarotase